MSGLGDLVGEWGYLALVPLVVLGNAGLPVPEEAVLAVAGYLAWRGQLRLGVVVAVGVLSAVAGDGAGYWAGRRYGMRTGHALAREARPRVGARMDRASAYVRRYGPVGVFLARFVPGARCLAEPVAGAAGLRVLPFLVANLLGAAVYVPLVVTAGYVVGSGLEGHADAQRWTFGMPGRLALLVATTWAGWWALRAATARRDRR